METEEMLRELADATKACDGHCNPCTCGEDEQCDPEKCQTCAACNCTGTVPAFPMLRVECRYNKGGPHRKWECDDVRGYLRDEGKSTEADWWKEDGDCPGWRAKTLDEVKTSTDSSIEAIIVGLYELRREKS